MKTATTTTRAALPFPAGEDWGKHAQLAIAGPSLSRWERVGVRVRRPPPNVAEILEA